MAFIKHKALQKNRLEKNKVTEREIFKTFDNLTKDK